MTFAKVQSFGKGCRDAKYGIPTLNFSILFLQCPLNDLFDDAIGKGMYQSMTEKSLLTVEVATEEFIYNVND